MCVLLDNCIDQKFGLLLSGHGAVHARSMGWATIENSALIVQAEIVQAEADGFHAMISIDKNLGCQQNTSWRKISIIILDSGRIAYRQLERLAQQIVLALRGLAEDPSITIKPKET